MVLGDSNVLGPNIPKSVTGMGYPVNHNYVMKKTIRYQLHKRTHLVAKRDGPIIIGPSPEVGFPHLECNDVI
ncbi:hypothetical protein skT53_06670 [Effusibacillus dendaii]|uniref:Uncharacterized protein n=1 Tax=Effusibacillus dendaii TaxID=2743772 RepID=A0A7I8D8J4_9BACL|nr:hypothetical protein skT53_06670 [Effusibacillus dendaii]